MNAKNFAYVLRHLVSCQGSNVACLLALKPDGVVAARRHSPSYDSPSRLAACRTWGVGSENRPQRGQFLPDLQAHGRAMGQKAGEKWSTAVDLQPTTPKSDRLLASGFDRGAIKRHFSPDATPEAESATHLTEQRCGVLAAVLRLAGTSPPLCRVLPERHSAAHLGASDCAAEQG